MNPRWPNYPISRRLLLERCANGFGALALAGLTGCQDESPLAPAATAPRAKAQSVIFLFMEGGPSQMDTFDPKPRLAVDNGRPCPIAAPIRVAREKILKSPFKFAKYGQCGADVSELFPHVAQHVDQIAFVRSMVADFSDHPTANYFLSTGTPLRGRPSMGSWIAYGLGIQSEELPGYVVLSGGRDPEGGRDCLGAGFMPAKFQATILQNREPALPFLQPYESPEAQRRKLALLRQLDAPPAPAAPEDQQFEAMLANYELAFRMQTSLPDALDIRSESQATRALYGIDDEQTRQFGTQCLQARKLVERGVRFVQLLPAPPAGAEKWDQHFNLQAHHSANARRVDQPIAGLLADLRARGLLDQTIVLWGGEFGRTPTGETSSRTQAVGRDHNRHGFTMWLAGGGVRPGLIYGATDEYGVEAIDSPTTVHDLHATILHLLGIDHTQLTYRNAGRDYRLTDVYGHVVHDLIA